MSRDLLAAARPAAAGVALTAVLGIAASGASVAVAVALAGVVSTVAGAVSGVAQPAALLGAAGFVALATLLRAVLLLVRDRVATETGLAATRALRRDLARHVLELGPGHRFGQGASAVRASVVDGVQHLQSYVGLYLPQVVVVLVVPAALLVVLATVAPWVALVIAAAIATVPLAQRLWSRMLGARAEVHWRAFESYASRVGDSLHGIVTLVSLGAVRRRSTALARDAETLRDATAGNLRASLGISVLTASAMSVGSAGATMLAAAQTAGGSIDPGVALLVLFLAAECFRPMQELQQHWHEGFHGIAALRGIRALLATEPPVADRADATPLVEHGPPALDVVAVTYAHPGADRPALRGVDLHVPAGATLALVGRSGSGKSTLASLLLRDVDPDDGAVLRGGIDLRDRTIASVRAASARVAQDVVLLDGTVRDCVRQGAPEATDAQVDAAARAARVDELAASLPDGLDSPVGEGGTLLSGGQRQRVALAAALLRRAPLLVLDEATSALDAENEGLVVDALRASRGERTTIVIAHRLSTVVDADLVAVLDDGELVELGPPADLATRDGHWARMLRAHDDALAEARR